MMPREGTIIADRYRLERKVGGGRVSATWRVQDEMTDTPCALKLLHKSMHKHPEALTRFSLEERLARELSGAYFPERVGSGSWNSQRYIAWRWYEGESLRALFERNPKQDAPTVQTIVQEACQALAIVHAAGYVHGDLKPENLFFADRGGTELARQLKLFGFGVASRIGPAASVGAQARRRPGEIVGTPLYLSPDQVLGRVPKGGQADLWALAVIVYEALTGRAPFLGNELGEVLEAILERKAPKPSTLAEHLPPTLDLWWAQALEQDFNTPGEFSAALARALAPALRSSRTQRSVLPERAAPAIEVGKTPAIDVGAVVAAPARSLTPAGVGPLELSRASADGSSDASRRGSLGSTAAGVGPAEASRTSSLGGTAFGVGAIEPPARAAIEPAKNAATEDTNFAPLPSPTRDLSAGLSRKTLVGITPPSSLRPPASPSSPPARDASAPARANGRQVIEGTPCKAIEVSAAPEPLQLDLANTGVDALRRKTSATMPFQRPRFPERQRERASEASAVDLGGMEQQRPSLAFLSSVADQPLLRETTRNLRGVLTSPDHKPQRVAAVVVCAAAALVIFFVGRSPVAGTGAIGTVTGALSTTGSTSGADRPATGLTTAVSRGEGAAPSADKASNGQVSGGAVDPAGLAPVSGSNVGADTLELDTDPSPPSSLPTPPSRTSPKPGDELAPGLTVPVDTKPAAKKPAPAPAPKPAPAVRPPAPRATPPAPAAPKRSDAPASPRNEQKVTAPKPPPAAAPPPAPRKSSGEFDFGI